MNILRRFAIPGKPVEDHKGRPYPTYLYVEECPEPDTVRITLTNESILLSKEAFEALYTLAKYTSYGENIRFTPEPTQAELPL